MPLNLSSISAVVIQAEGVRDLSAEALDDSGRLRVLPSAWWAKTTMDERGLFGHRQGLYGFVTVELVERIREVIAGRRAIEIGSGHGVLAQALGIPATDNKQMLRPDVAAQYQRTGQPLTRYGPNVEHLDAHVAVSRYKPQVVVCQWVTHRYDPKRAEAGGNVFGPDFRKLARQVDTLVFIGNAQVHALHTLWQLDPVVEVAPPYVFSRAANGSPDFFAVVNP